MSQPYMQSDGTVNNTNVDEQPTPRLLRCNVSAIIPNKGIPLVHYSVGESSLTTVSFAPVLHLQQPYVLPESCNLDILWHTGWFFRDEDHPRPSWGESSALSVVYKHDSN